MTLAVRFHTPPRAANVMAEPLRVVMPKDVVCLDEMQEGLVARFPVHDPL